MFSAGSLAVFEAWIATRDGKRLNEHQVAQIASSQGTSPVTRGFAEIEEGTREFEVCVKMIRNHGEQDGWGVNCWVDGRRLAYKGLWAVGNIVKLGEYHEEEDGVVYKRNLMFAPVPTVEDRIAAVFTAERKQNLGIIKITLDRGLRLETGGKMVLPPVTKAPITTLHETDVKAKCSSYIGGGTSQAEHRKYWGCGWKSITKGYHEFNFSYLTTASLVIRSIIDDPTPGGQATSHSRINVTGTKRKRDITNGAPSGDAREGSRSPASSPSKKRRRAWNKVTHLDDEKSAADLSLSQKRIQYLEEQNRKLQARLKRQTLADEIETVDLTRDDEE